MATVAPMSGVPYTLQAAKITGNGDIVTPPPSFRNHTFIITAASGVNAGAVQIETSNDSTDATNTWAQLGGGPITVTATQQILAEFTGIYNSLRARITTTIAGGGSPSVTVTYLGSKSY